MGKDVFHFSAGRYPSPLSCNVGTPRGGGRELRVNLEVLATAVGAIDTNSKSLPL